MASKLLDKTGAEMAAALVNIAAPLRRLMDDEEFDQAFKEATRKGLKTGMTDVLQIYTDLVPLLLGERHLKDTLAILAEIEGTTVSKMLKMNGTELLADALKAFNEQLKPFFMQLGLSVGVKP
jgi:hypothetical protein